MPEHPTVFVRVTTSLVAPGAPVIRPRVSEQLDYEVELVIVIGARCHDVVEDQALAHVFGYTIMNDVSVRDYQRRTSQWTLGKNFDGSGPMGPAIVTADELPAGARGLGIRTRLNGELLQDGNTADMVFPVPRIVALLSQVMTLEPGDVIATGTPSGRRPRAPAAVLDEAGRRGDLRDRRHRHARPTRSSTRWRRGERAGGGARVAAATSPASSPGRSSASACPRPTPGASPT